MDKTKTKIAIISTSLSEGGAERFAGLLSFMLHDLGYEIHNIIISNAVDFEYKGILHNLGKADNASGLVRKAAKSFLLQRCLSKNQIDIVIDNRPRNSFIRDRAAKFIFGKRKVIYVVHSFNLTNYLPKSVALATTLYRDASKLICVSKAIESKVKAKYHFTNTVTIYNPVDFSRLNANVFDETPVKYILFFGRLEEKVKNFTLMLNAFRKSGVIDHGFKLKIMGSGPDEAFIKNLIQTMGLEKDVAIVPFQKEPYEMVSNAKFTLLTSHFEGFPMSVIESLALGTPVVSVDCESGPSEIITNEYNGLLVANHDIDALANAIGRFAEEENLYDICRNNAVKSVAHLSMDQIAKQWQHLLSQPS